MKGSILSHQDALKFILAGNATATFLNTKTQKRFTFKVTLSKKNQNFHFVKVLTSPDVYQYIGSISYGVFKHSDKSKIDIESQSVRVFNYVFTKLLNKTLEDFIEIYHEGKCGKCGRKLTVPESITSGYGPECVKFINNKDLVKTKRNNKIDLLLN